MEKKMKLKQCIADIPSLSRRLFTVIIMMVASVLCTEAQTLINGLYYNLDSNTKTASVAQNTSASGDIVIPEKVSYANVEYKVTSLGDHCFYDCEELKSISIPNTVTSIGSYAFFVCASLEKIEIPNSVNYIGIDAFSACYSLESIIIPSSVTQIQGPLFSHSHNIRSIEVAQNNKVYDSRDNCNAIIETATNTLISACSYSTIPSSVTTIKYSAFFHSEYLASIDIPNSVTTIENYAFSGCAMLTQITCRANVPPTILTSSTFDKVDKSIPVYVPASSIDAYKSAQYWSEFTNFQAIAEPVKTEWRISDRTDIDVDFHSIEEAMKDERVQDGHTLYIERGTNLGNAEITKSVNVIGPGYDLADESKNANISELWINAEGATIVGIVSYDIYVNNTNISIKNCKINNVYGNNTNNDNDFCRIHSCFIDGCVQGFSSEGFTFDWTLTNNIMTGSSMGGIKDLEDATIDHNTIFSGSTNCYPLYEIVSSTVTNNIAYSNYFNQWEYPVDCLEKVSGSEMSYNIISYGDYDGNLAQEDYYKILSCTGDDSSEDYYTPVGVSLGYSTDGTDCGAFGGSEPYVKGGKSGLFVEREGEGGDEPEPEPEPTYPETPIVKGKLDNTATLDIENDVYNSLGEFLKALSIRGINTGTEIEVANQQFDIALDDESYGYIQTSAVALEMAKAYIYMKASNNAIFNITLSQTFAAAHASEVQTVLATIMGFANHIITTNIKILINGTQYQYTGFQVEPNDLLNLKNLYSALDGENWTNVKWSFLSNGRQASDFPGVTFTEPNEMGQSYVQELNLEKNNMKGDVSNLTLYFPHLTSLNMYYNQLTGDVTNMVSELESLKTLDISYNMLTGLTSLPASVATLNKGYQFRGDVNQDYLSKLSAATVYISDKQSVGLPTIMTYDLKTNSNVPTAMYISERSTSSLSAYYGQLVPHGGGSTSYYTSWTSKPYTYEYAQDHEIYLRTTDGTIYPAILKYETGDANMSGYTNLDDVQTTISKVLSPSVVSLFNTTAANTYNDETINVQDVVCTVNIVLGKPIVFIEIPTETGNHYDQPLLASRRATPVPGGTGNILFVKGERLWLTNETEVGAIEVELRGLQADEVSLALNRKDFQMASLDIEGGSRHIIYSLSGKSVPVSTAAILRLSSDYAEVADAALSSVDAKSLSFTIGVTPTAINTVDSGDMLKARFEGNNIVISSSREISNAEVIVTSASGVNALTWQGKYVNAGETMIEADLASGIYIIGIYENGKRIGNAKLIKK